MSKEEFTAMVGPPAAKAGPGLWQPIRTVHGVTFPSSRWKESPRPSKSTVPNCFGSNLVQTNIEHNQRWPKLRRDYFSQMAECSTQIRNRVDYRLGSRMFCIQTTASLWLARGGEYKP